MTARRLGRHLVIMARLPRLCQGKRRLARDLGELPTWRFQRRQLAELLRRLNQPGLWQLWLCVTPEHLSWPSEIPRPRGANILQQGAGDLGQRMARPFRSLPPGPLVMIGADIPEIVADDIRNAFRSLGRHPWVFGPAEDGGYWLIGARRRPAAPTAMAMPFDGVRWGSRHALADTLANLDRGNAALLRELIDVDTAEDLERVARRTTRPRRDAPLAAA